MITGVSGTGETTLKKQNIHFLDNNNRAFESTLFQHNAITKQEILDYCLSKKVLSVDTETQGLDFLTKKIVMFQIGDKDRQFVIDTRDISIEFLRPVLESREIVKVFHNVKFDYKFIKQWYQIDVENIFDTMIAERILSTGKIIPPGYHSLEQVCLRRLGKQLDKSTRNMFIDLKSQPFTEKQIVYGAEDVENLIDIMDDQLIYINKFELNEILDLENNAALAFSDIEFNGIGLDVERWKSIAKDSSIELQKFKQELNDEVVKEPKFEKFINRAVQLDMFSADTPEYEIMVNWSSPSQVLNLFQNIIPSLENVNAKELYTVKNRHSIISKYINYKEIEKKSNAYGLDFLKYVGADNRIHTSFNQILNTGRVSSRDPNMQQIPADNKFRNCFVSGYDEWVFVSSDYSSQELCIIAYGSKDPVWLSALEQGKDLHSVCAELVYGNAWEDAADPDCSFYEKDVNGEFKRAKCNCKEHKKLRNGVKTINFGLAYGMSKFKLADTLLISVDEADALIQKYFSTFPSIKNFLDSLGNYGVGNGFIKTFAPYKRISWFSNWNPNIRFDKDMFKELGSIERASKNTPIQGTGADMCKYALVLVREHIKKHMLPVKIVMAVHDQIDTIVYRGYAEQWKQQLNDLMKLSTLPIIKNGLLGADTNISDYWEK